jgi:hypothetical protein
LKKKAAIPLQFQGNEFYQQSCRFGRECGYFFVTVTCLKKSLKGEIFILTHSFRELILQRFQSLSIWLIISVPVVSQFIIAEGHCGAVLFKLMAARKQRERERGKRKKEGSRERVEERKRERFFTFRACPQ